jgi:hypothetical protein
MADIEIVESDAPKGLDAILSSAIEASEGVVQDVASAEATAETTTPEIKVDDAGRVRTPDGKFAPKEIAAPDGQAARMADKTPAVDPAAALQVQIPEGWSAEWKAKVATLPPEQQALAVDQYKAFQADYTKKSQELAETRRHVEPLLAESQRIAPFLQQLGYTPDKFLAESAIVAQRLMSGQPQQQGEALAYLAQLHRIPPETVVQALGLPVTQDGNIQAAAPEIQQLRQQVFELRRAQEQNQQFLAHQERLRAQAEFDGIGQSKDANGQPKFPHFERVKGTMIKLVANDLAQTWDQAYLVAVRSDDALYRESVESERKHVAEAAEKERQTAVEKAKNARPVKTSPATPGGGPQRKGLDAHLEAALERFNG